MKDATEIVVVLDKSGSMGNIVDDTIGGFNNFLKEQQEQPGEANLTLAYFDTTYSIPIKGRAIKAVEPLTRETYRPGGGTALLDAIGKAITETGARLADIPEFNRPSKVIVVVMTDGEENSSKEHTKAQIAEMIKHQEEKYDWAFLFLGAGMDSFHEARGLGVGQVHLKAANFAPSAQGIRSAYAGTSEAVSDYRSGGKDRLLSTDLKSRVDKHNGN